MKLLMLTEKNIYKKLVFQLVSKAVLKLKQNYKNYIEN